MRTASLSRCPRCRYDRASVLPSSSFDGRASRWDFTRLAARADDDLALAEAGLDEWAATLDREDRG